MRVLCVTLRPSGGVMYHALRALGYEPYTLRTAFLPGFAAVHPVYWASLLQGKERYNPHLFSSFDCFVGPPAALCLKEIFSACPPYTKVILLPESDPAGWASSTYSYSKTLRPFSRFALRMGAARGYHTILSSLLTATYGPQTSPPPPSGEEVRRFEEAVRHVVPSSQMLVFHPSEGWGPLCTFLQKDTPSIAFPALEDEEGLYVLGAIRERMERAERLFQLLLLAGICLTIYLMQPWYQWMYEQVLVGFREYKEAYSA